jgi:cytochrome P450
MVTGTPRCPIATDELDELLTLEPDALDRLPDHLARLQALGPVVWVPELDSFVVTRHAAAVEVLSHPELFSSGTGDPRGPKMRAQVMAAREELIRTSAEFRELMTRLEPDWRAIPVLAMVDPPVHAVHRRQIVRLFTARRVAHLAKEVRQLADELIDGFAGQDRVDLVAAFAAPLPLRVLAGQLGIERDRLDQFKQWVDDIVAPIGNLRFGAAEALAMTRSCVEFGEYFRPALAERRRHPRDDFLTLIAQMDDPEIEISEEERLGMIFFMLAAGIETSTKMLGAGIATLARRPDIAGRLRTDPELIPAFVEEALRLNAPLQGLYRFPRRDTVVAGVPIPAGASVWVLFGAASRDTTHLADAGEFRLDRPGGDPHLIFGRGIHYCAGAPLARLEATAGYEALLERVWPWRVVAEEREKSYLLWGHRRLEASFEPMP